MDLKWLKIMRQERFKMARIKTFYFRLFFPVAGDEIKVRVPGKEGAIPLYPQRGADPPEYLAGQPLVGVLFAVALPQAPASATHVAKQITTLAGANMSTDKRPVNPTQPQNAVNKGGECVAPPKADATHPFAQGRFFGLLTMDGSTVAE